ETRHWDALEKKRTLNEKTARRRFFEVHSHPEALCGGRMPPRGDTPPQSTSLTLGELLGAACGVQTDLLTLDFTCIAGDKACLAQHRLERRVIVDQGAGDAVAGS